VRPARSCATSNAVPITLLAAVYPAGSRFESWLPTNRPSERSVGVDGVAASARRRRRRAAVRLRWRGRAAIQAGSRSGVTTAQVAERGNDWSVTINAA
jgi:hypothetical protein